MILLVIIAINEKRVIGMQNISIERLRDGNQSAFRELVEVFQNRVVNTCFGFVHSEEDARDIAQEVFIEVWESIQYFNEKSSLSTWIYRISVNKSLDFIRKQNRKKRWGGLFRENGNNSTGTENMVTHNENPHQLIEQSERLKTLEVAINGLPENQRIAFTLHKYEDLSYQQIAEVMGTSVSAVESLMFRAKGGLRKKLYDFYRENL